MELSPIFRRKKDTFEFNQICHARRLHQDSWYFYFMINEMKIVLLFIIFIGELGARVMFYLNYEDSVVRK